MSDAVNQDETSENIGGGEQTIAPTDVEDNNVPVENNEENNVAVNEGNTEQDGGDKEEKSTTNEDSNKTSGEESGENIENNEEKTEGNEANNDEEKVSEEKTEPPPPQEEPKPVEENVKKITFSIPKDCVLTETEELLVAKTFLMKNSEKTNTNTYDHMSQIIMSILDSKIDNAVDIFETLSTQVKKKKFVPDSFNSFGEFRYVKETKEELEDAHVKMELFQVDNEDGHADDGNEMPDLMSISNLFEWAGLSLGKEETFLINASMQRLMTEKGLKSMRFWGKIYGTKKNYYIVEADQKDEDDDEEVYGEDDLPNPEEEEEGNLDNENDDEKEKEKENENENDENEVQESQIEEPEYPVPKIKIKKPNTLTKEIKTGINKYMYYVCNYVGGPWYKLADVIPEKLQISRKIRKYFTGDLNHEIISYPPFEGSEAQYLRCQIARISAATSICPTGYYVFDTEDGEPEDTEGPQPIIVNTEFEALSNDQLLDLSNWVHHVPYILPQGKTSWENPFGSEEDEENEEEGSEEEGSEEENEAERVEPESGPQLLTPISQDDENDDIPSWVSKYCSRTLAPQFNPVCISSTRWPGAHTVALSDKFSSIYIGDGMKCYGNTYLSAYHIPQPLTNIMTEYQENEVEKEITEQIDPTVEEEKAFEEEQAEKLREKEEDEEGTEEEEEEGSEED
ncbi:hypothetical protein BCR32DRAFT_324838 [Anaeromyces robustus]|uniref:Radial spokehead-like protein n=1 Tax=Anaeromyces robustus TaxID=1754192 RepID=A0A1Y1XLZ0_9FUNG|nr:hypothetical protein BCR32DRAFT_324838 [Anaeromyces robustus]|eukprot:ORX86769.1 hypothetical protein BCR32DRAFT_324838 [Anaeromyces robustus]